MPEAAWRGNRELMFSGYKICCTQWLSSSDLLYTIVPRVNKTVLGTAKDLMVSVLIAHVHKKRDTNSGKCWLHLLCRLHNGTPVVCLCANTLNMYRLVYKISIELFLILKRKVKSSNQSKSEHPLKNKSLKKK